MIDAMRYTKDLMGSGFTKDQANTSLKVFEEIMNQNFATKKDIKISEIAVRSDLKLSELGIRSDMKEMESGIRSDMKAEFSDVRFEMRTGFAQVRSDMSSLQDKITIRFTGVLIICMSVVIAAQKLL